MGNLQLSLKQEYFEQIRDGLKTEEYRLCNPYWIKRLEVNGHAREFDSLILTLGYPKKDDATRRLVFPWNGFVKKTITHPFFGANPIDVFAISLMLKSDKSEIF